MESFDVQSPLTNVPIDKVIDIVTIYTFTIDEQAGISQFELSQLLGLGICNVQFLFNGLHYKQIDVVTIVISLGPMLVDIFME